MQRLKGEIIMCLDVNRHARIEVAKAPIRVYKVLQQSDSNDGYVAPYRGTKYAVDGSAMPDVVLEEPFIRVREGYHSFKSSSDAVALLNLSGKNCVLFEATIPMGATYIKGEWAGCGSYVSSTIMIDRVYFPPAKSWWKFW